MNHQRKQQVRSCTFELQISTGTGNIKFPCSCFIEWKTSNGKDTIKSTNRIKLVKGQLNFNEKLSLTTHMVMDPNSQTYLKKESVVILNLLSNSRPNEPKLVGRATVELSSVANHHAFQEFKKYPLEFCSVGATLTFRLSLKDQQFTNLAVSELERSDFSDFEPILSEKTTQKEVIKINQEEVKSQSASPSISIAFNLGGFERERNLQNQNESNFKQRLNRIKTQNEQFKSSKTEEIHSPRTNGKLPKQKQLNTELSVPILAKEDDAFDSSKIIAEENKKQVRVIEFSFKNAEQGRQMNEEQKNQLPLQQNIHIQLKGQQKISSETQIQMRKQFQQLIQQNKQMRKEIQSQNIKIHSYVAEQAEHAETILKLKSQILEKDSILKQISQANYPNQIQFLNQLIQQKDNQISTLCIQNTRNQQKYSSKQAEFNLKVIQLNNTLRDLQERTKQNNPSYLTSTQSNLPAAEGNTIIQDLKYKLQLEQNNLENAKLELTQLRQWYQEMQQQRQKLQVQNQYIKLQLEQEQNIVKQLQQSISQFNEENPSIKQKQTIIQKLTQELSTAKQSITSITQLLQTYQAESQQSKVHLQAATKQLEDLELKYLQQQSHLQSTVATLQEQSAKLQSQQKQLTETVSLLSSKQDEVEDGKKKLSDLIKRMKQKEDNQWKLQRDAQQLQSKFKSLETHSERMKQRIKVLQIQKTSEQDRAKGLQKEIKQLKSKLQKQSDSLTKEISKLKISLQNQNNKKLELNRLLNNKENKQKQVQNHKNQQMQTKLYKYIQKERLLKENLTILEEESNKISDVLQQKQEEEERYTQTIVHLTSEANLMKSKINQLQNNCILLSERNQGLEAQLELLNSYQPYQQTQSQTIELNKKLIDKNKQLLHLIEEKNQLIVEYQKSEGEMKGKQIIQVLSQSRKERERQNYQQKYEEAAQENEKLYKQFQKLNIKYQEEIEQCTRGNEEKVNGLEVKIEQFYVKMTEKDVKYGELQLRSKEEIQKIEQTLHEKQYQLEYFANQIKELTGNVQSMMEQLAEKQFQLHLADNKIKQLQETIKNFETEKPEIIQQQPLNNNQELQQELRQWKSKAEFYEAQIERLHQKQFILSKDIITTTEELSRLRQNCEEEIKHISYLEGELKNFRERQTQYIQQIDQLEAKENLAKSRSSKLQKEKVELNSQAVKLASEVQRLKGEVQKLNEQMEEFRKGENSKESTPINKFNQTPSPEKENINMTDIVQQIDAILSRRKQEEELENALRLVIDNNARQEQQFECWSRERGMIQEKAKLASKQLQKIKSSIMKTPNRSISEKTHLTDLLKPAETIVNELINISEQMNELDPYEEVEEEQFQNTRLKTE